MNKVSVFYIFLLLLFPVIALTQESVPLLFNDKLEVSKKDTQKNYAKRRFNLQYSSVYYHRLADKLKLEGQLREAVKNYEYSILLNPSSAEVYYALGEIYFYLKQYNESISYLKQALNYPFEFDWDKKKVHYLLIINYFTLSRDSEAIEVLNSLISNYQSDIDREAINGLNVKYDYYGPAFFLLSLYYRNTGNLNAHIEILQRALQLSFKKEYINYFLYEFFSKKQQDSIAWEYLKQAKNINPNIEKQIKEDEFIYTYNIYKDLLN